MAFVGVRIYFALTYSIFRPLKKRYVKALKMAMHHAKSVVHLNHFVDMSLRYDLDATDFLHK